jgi:hypothetical protein
MMMNEKDENDENDENEYIYDVIYKNKKIK